MKTSQTILHTFKLLVLILTLFLVVPGSSQDLRKMYRQATKAMKHEQYAEAIPLLKTLVAHDSLNSRHLFYLALAMYETRDYQGCVAYSAKGIHADSTYAAHPFRRGLCHLILQNYAAAIHDLTSSIELDKQSFSYYNRALARWNSDDPDGAIVDFTTALTLNSNDEEAYHGRALCYEEIGDMEKAMTDINKAIALNPRDPEIYDSRAYLKSVIHDYSGAQADHLKSIELDPTYVLAYLNLAEISLINSDWLLAYQHASNGLKYADSEDDRAVALLLRCIANKLLDRDTSSDQAKFEHLAENLEEISWEFDDLQRELKEQNLPAEKMRYIDELIWLYYEGI